MPLLGPADPLPAHPARVLVAGPPGAGKTSLARALAHRLELPHTELDALFHGPGWSRRPQFEADVAALVAGERWGTEYQYDDARPLLLARCDLLVSLQLPVPVALSRLARRTLHRRRHRVELWNGNVEPPLRTVLTDPDHILRWGWRNRATTAERTAHAVAARPDLAVVVLRSAPQVTAWLAGPVAAATLTP